MDKVGLERSICKQHESQILSREIQRYYLLKAIQKHVIMEKNSVSVSKIFFTKSLNANYSKIFFVFLNGNKI